MSRLFTGLLLTTSLLTACQPVPGAFRFALDAADEAGTAPVSPTGRPPATTSEPRRPPDAAPGAIAPPTGALGSGGSGGGGQGGGAPAAPVLTEVRGVVLDDRGNPLMGAIVASEGVTTTTAGDGSFVLTTAPGSLTATATGHIPQTLVAPYDFRLAPESVEPGADFTITGQTQPPAPGARALFVDESGTSAGTTVRPDGSFELPVTPMGPNDGRGLLAIVSDLNFPVSQRFGVLQAATPPRLGALRLNTQAPGGPVVVPMRDATGECEPRPGAAGLPVAGASLHVVDNQGLVVPLGDVDGTWPTRVPTFSLPGFHVVLALSAGGEDGQSIVERSDPAPGEIWRPEWLPLPEVPAPAAGRVNWRSASPVAVTATRSGMARPAWAAVPGGSATKMPALPPGEYELEVRAVDGEPPGHAMAKKGARGDRRQAWRRVMWVQPE
ncbi:MAG: hypothetical protein ACK46X_05825 [Candidatus Sericytochromatia bacterium]